MFLTFLFFSRERNGEYIIWLFLVSLIHLFVFFIFLWMSLVRVKPDICYTICFYSWEENFPASKCYLFFFLLFWGGKKKTAIYTGVYNNTRQGQRKKRKKIFIFVTPLAAVSCIARWDVLRIYPEGVKKRWKISCPK